MSQSAASVTNDLMHSVRRAGRAGLASLRRGARGSSSKGSGSGSSVLPREGGHAFGWLRDGVHGAPSPAACSSSATSRRRTRFVVSTVALAGGSPPPSSSSAFVRVNRGISGSAVSRQGEAGHNKKLRKIAPRPSSTGEARLLSPQNYLSFSFQDHALNLLLPVSQPPLLSIFSSTSCSLVLLNHATKHRSRAL